MYPRIVSKLKGIKHSVRNLSLLNGSDSHVDEEVSAASTLKEHAERGEDDGEAKNTEITT
jgi:hypothetical protein